VKICHVFISSTFFHLPIFPIILIIISSFCHILHILWVPTNLSFKLNDLHQNMMCGKCRCYAQIMDWFHDKCVSDHLVKLSKSCLHLRWAGTVVKVLCTQIFIIIP
jgi:hypothetical protein